jgi:tryptophan synthase alpha subunit
VTIADYAHLILALQGQPALVTFVTAGFPKKEDTVPVLLAMQAGGADILELGMPFSDPIADGPVIQESNTVCCVLACVCDNLIYHLSDRLEK